MTWHWAVWTIFTRFFFRFLSIMKCHVSDQRRRQHPYEDVCLARARLSNALLPRNSSVHLRDMSTVPPSQLCSLLSLFLFDTYLKYLPCSSSYYIKRFILSTSFQISVQKHSNFAISYPVSFLTRKKRKEGSFNVREWHNIIKGYFCHSSLLCYSTALIQWPSRKF